MLLYLSYGHGDFKPDNIFFFFFKYLQQIKLPTFNKRKKKNPLTAQRIKTTFRNDCSLIIFLYYICINLFFFFSNLKIILKSRIEVS